MKTFVFTALFLLAGFHSVTAQNITGKVVDAESGESIPYANILVNNSENLVTNAEGFFTISENSSDNDVVLTVSYLGYISSQVKVGDLKNKALTIKLKPAVFELESVNTTKPDPNVIMATVRKNLAANYHKKDSQPIKNSFFMRESTVFTPKKLNVEISKSTGFTKKQLESVNKELKAFTSSMISHPPQEFTDRMGHDYNGTKVVEGKTVPLQKVEIVKATKLKDENRSTSFEELQEKAGKIFLTHLDTAKYYRIKSGLFGSRDTVSLRKDFNKKKNKTVKNNLTASKAALDAFKHQTDFIHSNTLDFVKQADYYEYKYEGAIYSEDNAFVYVLQFKPKKSKAKYTGKLYISESDYAIVKVDYQLAKGKTLGGINLKLLLGVKAFDNVSNGTLIYKKNEELERYYLQYASVETGQYIYLNRPLKFIELAESDKDVVAFDFKMEGNTADKIEFLTINQSSVGQTVLEEIKESDFKYTLLKRYDPSIWKDYSAIEPLEEMKRFAVEE